MLLLLALSCKPDPAPDDSAGPGTVPWSASLPPTATELADVRGYRPRRGIIHLHSPWSHDACDGLGYVDGVVDTDCAERLRLALCTTQMDYAYLSDHPDYATTQLYDDLFFFDPDVDTEVLVDGNRRAIRVGCEDGHNVLWMPGIEDILMPVGLDEHSGDSLEEAHALYNEASATSIEAHHEAGAIVLMAHTEGKSLEQLTTLQAEGLQGTEMFNLHAMFAPDIREEDLGLDPYQWALDIAPFTSPDASAEPDLLVLAVLQDQAVSLERFDALQQTGHMVGTAGTDAHENVLPLELVDGERVDSYRRMLRWFSNVLLTTGDDPTQIDEALTAGRNYVAFEVLGTPVGFDFWLEDADGTAWEMGSDAPQGTLHVGCPTLSPSSPRGLAEPEIVVSVVRDGQTWQTACGDFATEGPGAYRVEVHMIPWHLQDFLGEEPESWMKPYPWVYSNPIRVDLDR